MAVKAVNTDVLVVGSGAAGLMAAIEARRQGVKVVLTSKSLTGLANCSVYSGGILTVPLGAFTNENYFKTTLEVGKYMNDQGLIEVLANEASSRVLELQEYGVNLAIGDGGCRVVDGAFPMEGAGLVKPLVEYAKNVGVKTLENTMILDLLSDDAVNGAVGFNVHDGDRISVNAKAVVLASGGAGQVYQRNDNPVRTTGDGYAMAYELGLPLIDMEFVQFWPIGSAEPEYPMFYLEPPPLFLACGVLRNVQGEDIVKKYGLDPKLAYSTQRDIWATAIAMEVYEGRGEDDAVLLDLIKLPKSLRKHGFIPFLSKFFKGFPISTMPLHVSPLVHHFMGGIPIDEECKTKVAGLFAVGEVTGGIHGANRLGGNALTECIVYGARAGRYASTYAKTKSRRQVDEVQVKEQLKRIDEIAARKALEQGNPKVVREKIQKIMWKKAGVIRSKQGLMGALEDLRQLNEENLPFIHGEKPHEVMEAVESENLFTVANLVVRAALTRTESRGAHYRIDYPNQDDKNWLKHVVLTKSRGEIKVTTCPVIMTKLFP